MGYAYIVFMYAGLARTGKSCRLRWVNYLRPDVKRGPFDMEEVAILVQLYQLLGNKYVTYTPFR